MGTTDACQISLPSRRSKRIALWHALDTEQQKCKAVLLTQLTVYTAMKYRWLLCQRVTILFHFQIILSTHCYKCDCPVNRLSRAKDKKQTNNKKPTKEPTSYQGFMTALCQILMDIFLLQFHQSLQFKEKNNSSQFRASPWSWPSALDGKANSQRQVTWLHFTCLFQEHFLYFVIV